MVPVRVSYPGAPRPVPLRHRATRLKCPKDSTYRWMNVGAQVMRVLGRSEIPKNIFILISYRVLSHQVEYRIRIAAPDCNFYFKNRDDAISERIAPRLLHIIQVRPRYLHREQSKLSSYHDLETMRRERSEPAFLRSPAAASPTSCRVSR